MIDLLKNIVEACPADRVLMGMDIGAKTIGVSLSDSRQSIATPLTTIKRKKFTADLKALEEIVRDYQVGGFVVGFPLHMDDSEGRKCQSIRDFALEFEKQLSEDLKNGEVWIGLWDERLSTNSVEDFVDKTGSISKRRAKDKGIIDKLAAQHILQGALEFMRGVRQ